MISCGYSYFRSSSEKSQSSRIAHVCAISSGENSLAIRLRPRRCCSAFDASAYPHSGTGIPSRIAVITSCSGLHERLCIVTSPSATTCTPRRLPAARISSACTPSSARCNCTSPSRARSPNVARNHATCASSTSARTGYVGTRIAKQSRMPRRCATASGGLDSMRGVSLYVPFGAFIRSHEISSDRLP